MTQMNKPFTQEELNGVIGLFKVAPMTMFVRGARMVSAAECAQHGFVVITEGGALVDPVPANIFSNRLRNVVNQQWRHGVAGLNSFLNGSAFKYIAVRKALNSGPLSDR